MEIRAVKNESAISTLHRAVFLLNKIVDAGLQASVGFGFPQFLILSAIEKNPGVSQLRVAKYLDLTEAAVSKQTGLMIGKKLIHRAENPLNRREHVLNITTVGLKKLMLAKIVLDKKMAEIFLVLDNTEQDRLRKILEKIVGKIHGKGVRFYCCSGHIKYCATR